MKHKRNPFFPRLHFVMIFITVTKSKLRHNDLGPFQLTTCHSVSLKVPGMCPNSFNSVSTLGITPVSLPGPGPQRMHAAENALQSHCQKPLLHCRDGLRLPISSWNSLSLPLQGFCCEDSASIQASGGKWRLGTSVFKTRAGPQGAINLEGCSVPCLF